jgi:hypothetical protein
LPLSNACDECINERFLSPITKPLSIMSMLQYEVPDKLQSVLALFPTVLPLMVGKSIRDAIPVSGAKSASNVAAEWRAIVQLSIAMQRVMSKK